MMFMICNYTYVYKIHKKRWYQIESCITNAAVSSAIL